MLQSLVVSVQENHHGDTAPDDDADEHCIMANDKMRMPNTETSGWSKPILFLVLVSLCVLLGTIDFHWNVSII